MLAWMDLEMTGLDVTKDVILEIATVVTDDQLEIVAEGPDLVVRQPAEALDGMVEVVRSMHERSGLTRAVKDATLSLDEAGDRTMSFLKEHIAEPRTVPLCGNSIGTDRRFLATYLPEIDNFLHYRSVDVSTVKELARRWYPGALAGAPKKASNHRALDDIRESIQELRYYREKLFVPAGADGA
jgi:oligoribonuclease